MRPKHWGKEEDAKLIEHWEGSYLKELAVFIGCSVNTIRAHAALLGLTLETKNSVYKAKRAETNRQAAIKAGKRPPLYAVGHKHTEDAKRRIGEARRKLYASERRRILFGLPQRTNIKVKF